MIDIYDTMENLLIHTLKNNSKTLGNLPAIISEDITLTHLQLHQKILNAVFILEKENISQRACIGLRFINPVLHLIFNFALFQKGIAQVSINPYDPIASQLNTIEKTGIDLIIQDIPLNNVLKRETLYLTLDFKVHKKMFDNRTLNNSLPLNTIIAYLGSGTTDEPKVMTIDSRTLAKRIEDSLNFIPIDKEDRVFSYSKFYYPFARSIALITLIKGGTVFLYGKGPENIIDFCIQNKIDHLQLTVSQTMNFLLNNIHENNHLHLPNLKSLLLYGSLVTQTLRNDLLSRVTENLYIAYGTNEVGIISIATPKDLRENIDSIGKAIPNVSIKIVDDNGKDLDIGEVGNILVHSPNIISEYLNNPEDTQKSFTKDGYFPGDMGRLTQNGNLIFEGRKDDMMIYTGENIYPKDIESVLDSHENVIESAVFPLTINNQDGIPFAVVVVKEAMDEKILLDFCEKKLGWKRPQRIFFIKKLPRNDAGKVLKRLLSEQMIKILTEQTI